MKSRCFHTILVRSRYSFTSFLFQDVECTDFWNRQIIN